MKNLLIGNNLNENNNKTKFKIFLSYAIPSIAAMWVFSMYTMIDGMFVANFVGPQALAAVNISMPYINFIFAFSLLISTGASTIIAISFGKGEKENAKKLFTLTTGFLIIISLVISILLLFNLDKVSNFLGATDLTRSMVMNYIGIIGFFTVFFVVSYQFEVLVKTDGFPKLATFGVICSAITNIILDYLFIGVLGWGVSGAALATGISQVVSTAIFLSYFLSKRSTLKLVKFWPGIKELKILGQMALIGVSDSVTEFSSGIMVFIFNQSILILVGEMGIVSYTIVSYANLLVLMTMMGISQGMQPLVSYSYGKKDIKSIKFFLNSALFGVFICSLMAILISIFKAEWIVGLFINKEDIELFNYSLRVYKLYSLSFGILGFNVVLASFFAAIEKPKKAISISLGRGLVLIMAVLIIMVFLFGEIGLWISPLISELICLGVSLSYYYSTKKNIIKDYFSE